MKKLHDTVKKFKEFIRETYSIQRPITQNVNKPTFKKTYWDPEYYKNHSQIQNILATNTLKHYAFKENEVVLDIGSGTGSISAEIASKVPNGKIIGIDYSSEMVEYAKLSYQSVNNLSFLQANAVDFTFNQQFDLITSFNTMHWVHPQLYALQNIYKHLKPNGVALVNLRIPLREKEIVRDALNAAWDNPKWKPYLTGFIVPFNLHGITLEEYVSELKNIGFEVLLFNASSLKYNFRNLEDLAMWMQGWIQQVSVIPPELTMEYLLEIADYYVQHVCKNNEIYYVYEYWEYMVRKL